VENNLGRNEEIVQEAKLNTIFLVGVWVFGILFCWLLFIPLVKAIIETVKFNNIELAITNKRVIGKTGVVNTSSLDAPLNKVQNSSVKQTLFGKIFNYGIVKIDTAAGSYTYGAVKDVEEFKRKLMVQIDKYEEDKVKQQAAEMAKAMANAVNH